VCKRNSSYKEQREDIELLFVFYADDIVLVISVIEQPWRNFSEIFNFVTPHYDRESSNYWISDISNDENRIICCAEKAVSVLCKLIT